MVIDPHSAARDTEIDLSSLLRALWRRKLIIAFFTLLGLGTGLAVLFLVDPVFNAHAKVLIERRETVFTRPSDEQSLSQQTDFDRLSIVSQVEVMQSRNILRTVAESLRLATIEEFNPPQSNSLKPLESIPLVGALFEEDEPLAPEARNERVLSILSEKIAVYAVTDSRVVAIDVQSKDPALAAAIANAIADEYIRTQRADTREDTESASEFLASEITDLREKLAEAERKVEAFRADAGLIAAAEEANLVKQQLGETLTLLSEVSAQWGEAEAKADQIRRLIQTGGALDSSSDVQGSPLIQRLREQQVALKARIVDLSTSLLPSHPQVRAAQLQLDDLEEEINRQAILIAQALEGDAEVAKVRQEELQREVARLKQETAQANKKEIELRALEREARAQRELLETYLNRFREATARQNTELLPVNARIISPASVPLEIHFPKKIPTLGVAAFAGMFASSLFVLLGALLSAGPARRLEPFPEAHTGEWNGHERREIPLLADHTNRTTIDGKPMRRRSDFVERRQSASPAQPSREEAVIAMPGPVTFDGEPEPAVEMQARGPEEHEPFDPAVQSTHDERFEKDERNERQVATAVSSVSRPNRVARKGQRSNARPARKAETDLYSAGDVIETIRKHKLQHIAVRAVEAGADFGSFALKIARKLDEQNASVCFIDLRPPQRGDGLAPEGLSDVLTGDSVLEDALLPDPETDVDLLMHGRASLYDEDWTDGHISEVLELLTDTYDHIILHIAAPAGRAARKEIDNVMEMIVYTVDKAMMKADVATLLEERLGEKVPGHTMFVMASGKDAIDSAA